MYLSSVSDDRPILAAASQPFAAARARPTRGSVGP